MVVVVGESVECNKMMPGYNITTTTTTTSSRRRRIRSRWRSSVVSRGDDMTRLGVPQRRDMKAKVMRRIAFPSSGSGSSSSSSACLLTLSNRKIPPPVAIMKSLAVACTFLLLVLLATPSHGVNVVVGNETATSPRNLDYTTTSIIINTTASTTTTINVSSDGRRHCPATCFCDLESSLISCAGAEGDAMDVIWASNNNKSSHNPTSFDAKNYNNNNNSSSNSNNNNVTTSAVPADVWSVVADEGILRLDVRDLIIRRLDKDLVNGTERLSELSLVRCGLADIGDATFARHANLERLDFSQNQLTILTQDMLTGLIRLRSLDLSSNKLTLIDGALETLVTLEQLNLRGNALVVLGPDAFKGVNRLQFLNVDGNHISAIAESAFQGLGQLAHLVLSCNPLGGIQHVDLFAARPAYVDLSSAGLTRVPSLIARYVRDLRLSGNNFGRLQRGDFESVPQVRSLVLDESHIGDIEEDTLGRMDLLEQLSLNGNELASVPASLPSASLSALHLEANRITALRAGDFVGLRRLDQLHLAHNVIVSIATGTFDQLTSLTRLDLRGNKLSAITKDVFGGLIRLRFLDLSDNPLVIPRVDAERLRHLTAVVKVVITTFPQEKLNSAGDGIKDDDGSIVAKETELSDAAAAQGTRSAMMMMASKGRMVESSVVRRLPDNGANEASASAAAAAEVAKSTSPQQGLVLVGALLSLSLLIVVLFIVGDRLMKRSRWNRDKTTTALWRRRGVAGVSSSSADGPNSLPLPQKDVVRLGWVPVEDFDHWSTALLQHDTEHERLLLAVTPHH